MAKARKKTGKGRLDKFYRLAKEQGYRARSAFKLIQLNKKYAFLNTARCTIDLCAAPGGWLQVASKFMPINSIIVGVDLVSIQPISRVITLKADITSPECRNLLLSELKDWKADVVLHDGAPNVGTAWIQDAYSQSELVLSSLKVAVEFLVKGGTFVTKVFRSVDYNNLIWVLNQLFERVEATKPSSSRNVSAEIFVVCREFLAPKFIDPKFLDPGHVFKEPSTISSVKVNSASINKQLVNIYQPGKTRRQRDGYADGDFTLFKTINAADFIRSQDPVSLLGSANKIVYLTDEENEWLNMDLTSSDVRANCEDLKVLGKGDFKSLLKWRLALRREIGLDYSNVEIKGDPEAENLVKNGDQEQQLTTELALLNAAAFACAKRKKRRANELRARTIQRMQLQMTAPLDIGLEDDDLSLRGQFDEFPDGSVENFSSHKRWEDNFNSSKETGAEESTADDFDTPNPMEDKLDFLEMELDGSYAAYQDRLRLRNMKYKARESRKRDMDSLVWAGIQDRRDADDVCETDTCSLEDIHRVETSDVNGDEDGFECTKRTDTNTSYSNRHVNRIRLDPSKPEDLQLTFSKSRATDLWFSQEIFNELEGEVNDQIDVETKLKIENITNRISGDFKGVPKQSPAPDLLSSYLNVGSSKPKAEQVQAFELSEPETFGIAQKLVNRQTTASQLIDDGFHRYSLNSSEGLPSWFLDDESKHCKSNIPVTKQAMDAFREKQRKLDARPIKKIAEAKARKKYKNQQRLEKAFKKADSINETADLSEREKSRQIEKLLRDGRQKSLKRKREKKVIVAKGAYRGIKGRPKGIKGRYLMVDARMKKELRTRKRLKMKKGPKFAQKNHT